VGKGGGAPLSEPSTVSISKSIVRRANDIVASQNGRLVLALAIMAVVISSKSQYFLTIGNMLNIGQAVAVTGVLAVVETLVIVSGGIDLSVGTVPGLCAVTAAVVIETTHSGPAGVGAALVVGALAGLVNGLIITVGRVNAVIATLATFTAFEGVALLVANGAVIGINDDGFNSIGSGRIGGIPIPILVLAVAALGAHIVMRYTDFGRHIYAFGANPAAARLVGINVDRWRVSLYVIAGIGSGVAGILLSARATGASPLQGTGMEFDVITAVVLGGAALAGGKGTLTGTMLGVLIIGALYNGLILLQVQSFWQYIVQGALLAGVVILQERRRARS